MSLQHENNKSTQRMSQDSAQGGTLVHLNVQAAIGSDSRINSIIVRERPFIGDLGLDTEPNDKELLIALGEVMGVSQPLTVNRISCMGRLAILWVNENRWLVLPPAGAHESVLQAMRETFGEDLKLEESSGQLKAHLTQAAIHYLLSSSNTQQFSDLPVTEAELSEGISIMSLHDTQDYDILVRKSCAESLWNWLQQNTGSTRLNSH